MPDESTSIGAKISDRIPSTPSTSEPSNAVESASDELGSAVANVVVTLLIAITKLVPFTERFWRGLINAGYRGLYKKSGADHLGHILVGNEIKIVPVNYDYDKKRFENEHGDWWKAPTEADYEYRVAGKVPAVWAAASSNHVGSHLQAEVAEVLDIGKSRPLYESADVQVEVDATNLEQAGGGSQAMADGGGLQMHINGEQPGAFRDEIVDLSHEANGRVVSMEKYYQTYPAVVDPEEMQLQEWRGRKAEESRDYAKFAMKMLLIAGGIIAAVTLGPPLISAFFGSGGGGGGGSVLPAMIGGVL